MPFQNLQDVGAGRQCCAQDDLLVFVQGCGLQVLPFQVEHSELATLGLTPETDPGITANHHEHLMGVAPDDDCLGEDFLVTVDDCAYPVDTGVGTLVEGFIAIGLIGRSCQDVPGWGIVGIGAWRRAHPVYPVVLDRGWG